MAVLFYSFSHSKLTIHSLKTPAIFPSFWEFLVRPGSLNSLPPRQKRRMAANYRYRCNRVQRKVQYRAQAHDNDRTRNLHATSPPRNPTPPLPSSFHLFSPPPFKLPFSPITVCSSSPSPPPLLISEPYIYSLSPASSSPLPPPSPNHLEFSWIDPLFPRNIFRIGPDPIAPAEICLSLRSASPTI